MKTLTYKRLYGSDRVTMGEIYIKDEDARFYILEPPWKDNKKNVSCIPSGKYNCVFGDYTTKSGKTYPAYEIMNVPRRTNVKIHIGNFAKDTEGCPLIGLYVDYKGELIKDSTEAHYKFLNLMNAEDFILDIQDYDGISRRLPIKGVQGKMREKTWPLPKISEWAWERKFSHWIIKVVSAIKRGIAATQPYEEPWKKTARRIIEALESLLKVLAKWGK